MTLPPCQKRGAESDSSGYSDFSFTSDDEPGPSAAPQTHRRASPEVITANTRLKDSNKGMQMLLKMGYKRGTGLGKDGKGRVDPIPLQTDLGRLGLGKAKLDDRMLDSVALKARLLESERMANETDDQRAQREASVQRKADIKAEITATLRPFYCEICDKQYKTTSQFNEHLQSYDHHHKKRFKELQDSQRAKDAEAGKHDARREKERKREEKEMARMAKAAGVHMSKPTLPPPLPTTAIPPTPPADPPADSKKGGFKPVGGFAPVNAPLPATAIPPEQKGFFKINASAVIESSPSATPASQQKAPAHQRAPAFQLSKATSIPSTRDQPPARSTPTAWKPTNAPELHPLLAGDTHSASTSYSRKPPAPRRNNLDLDPGLPLPNLEPSASKPSPQSILGTKKMVFAKSGAPSVKPPAPAARSRLQMDDDDEEDDGMLVGKGARMPKMKTGKR